MSESVGVRELRQNLSKYLERVKAGESLGVTERGRLVARLVPSGASIDAYAELAARFGTSVPVQPLESIVAELPRAPHPRGTTDAFLAESRGHRA